MMAIDLLADEGTWSALDTGLIAADPLEFVDSKAYPDRVETARPREHVAVERAADRVEVREGLVDVVDR